MDKVMYILLGFFDAIAIIILAFKIFRWPFWEHVQRITIVALLVSLASYLDRYILNIPSWDMLIQFVVYVIALRYLLEVKLQHGIDVIAVGYLSYVGLQFIIYPSLLGLNIVTMNDAQELTGFGPYLIQISTQLVCFAIGYLVYQFNSGFSFKLAPPHDLPRKLSGHYRKAFQIVSAVGVIAVCSTMYWVFNHHAHLYIVVPSVLLSLVAILFISYKKDYAYARNYR